MGVLETLQSGALDLGSFLFDAPFRLTGHVGPFEAAKIGHEAGLSNAHALGPNATDAERVKAYNAASNEVHNFLKGTNAHPTQALSSPSLGLFGDDPGKILRKTTDYLDWTGKVVKSAVTILAVGAVAYFAWQFWKYRK